MSASNFLRPARNLTDVIATQSRQRKRTARAAVSLEAATSAPRLNDLSPPLNLESRAIASLTYGKHAPRKCNALHVAEVVTGITTFGNCDPILITAAGEVIDGIIRVEALKSLGIDDAPCVVVGHLTTRGARRLRLSINRLAEKGEWDLPELRFELDELCVEVIDIPGISSSEIDAIRIGDPEPLNPAANKCPVVGQGLPVTVLGDEWRCGPHRVHCADACLTDSYERLFIDSPAARVMITDPPFGCKIDGHVSGKGGIQHREFVNGTSNLSNEELEKLLGGFIEESKDYLLPGGLALVFMDHHGLGTLLHVGAVLKLALLNLIVWNKGRGGMGGLYRSQHEMIALFKCGPEPHLDCVNLGKHGRDRTNVWDYPGATTPGSSARKALDDHPTPKSVEMIADAILDVTKPGEIVLDPFLGSGTTLIAAQVKGRVAYGFELDPLYVDVILRRFESFTGQHAIHAATGKTFKEITAERHATPPSASVPSEPSSNPEGYSHA